MSTPVTNSRFYRKKKRTTKNSTNLKNLEPATKLRPPFLMLTTSPLCQTMKNYPAKALSLKMNV